MAVTLVNGNTRRPRPLACTSRAASSTIAWTTSSGSRFPDCTKSPTVRSTVLAILASRSRTLRRMSMPFTSQSIRQPLRRSRSRPRPGPRSLRRTLHSRQPQRRRSASPRRRTGRNQRTMRATDGSILRPFPSYLLSARRGSAGFVRCRSGQQRACTRRAAVRRRVDDLFCLQRFAAPAPRTLVEETVCRDGRRDGGHAQRGAPRRPGRIPPAADSRARAATERSEARASGCRGALPTQRGLRADCQRDVWRVALHDRTMPSCIPILPSASV